MTAMGTAQRTAQETALGAATDDLQQVEALVKRAGTSFYRGMKVLPPDRRAAMYAVYAFCRIVDDVADEPGPVPDKLAGLAAWRARIAALYAGQADDAVTRVLLPAIRTYALRQEDFIAVIDGMAMDTDAIIAPDLATLDLYCDRVAAAVGRLSVRAFGDSSADADRVAWHLGRALQLTNILRDVAEDAGRGRLYLPREWLEQAGVPSTPDALHHPGLAGVCARVAAEAREHFDAAHAGMRLCSPAAMRPARLMSAAYDALLHRLERRGWNRLDLPVRVPRWQKLLIALRYAR